MSAALAMMRAAVPGFADASESGVLEYPVTRYTFKIGDGDGLVMEFECTPEQKVCLMNWIRNHDLRGFMDELHKSSQPVQPGEKRPCGCGG